MSDAETQWWDTTENDDVATKPTVWRPLDRAIGGFDLDPAAGCEPTQIATERYTPEDDGLTSPWHGTVWLNPPFSEKEQWYKRLVGQYLNGDVERAIAIATTDTSAGWYQDWFSTADVICHPQDRDLYLGKGDSPSFITQIGAWNPTEEVLDVFHRWGTVVEPVDRGVQSTL